MRKLIITAIAAVISAPANAAECSGRIYQSGKEPDAPAEFYNLQGTLVGYSDTNGQFSIACTGQQIFVVHVDNAIYKAILKPGSNNIIVKDNQEPNPDPACCENCKTSDWYSTGKTGYQRRDVYTGCVSCKCSYETEYRCGDGWRGNTTDGETGCYPCGGFVRDINGQPIKNAKFYNVLGELVATTGETGEFGMECETESTGIHIMQYDGVSSKLIFTQSFIPEIQGPQFLISNEIEITTCTQSLEHWDGYYCVGIIQMQCPASADGAPVASGTMGNSCYIPAGTPISDETGTFEYTSDCHYTN